MSYPHGLFLDTLGNLYIADTFNDEIKKLNLSTNQITTLSIEGLSFPESIFVYNSEVYVTDTDNACLKKYNETSRKTDIVLDKNLKKPSALFIDKKGVLYLADKELNQIFKINIKP